MKCAVHPDVEASGYCRNCGKPMCPACVRPVRDVLYCEECLAKVVGLAPPPVVTTDGSVAPAIPAGIPSGSSGPHQGSPALAFILGLVPGLGAIYNGDYNKALLHIIIFAGIILGLNLDMGGGADAVLGIGLAVFVFYMAIDAVRSLKARQSGQNYEDPLENLTKGRAIGPIVLIGLGVLVLLHNFGIFEMFRIRQFILPAVLIGIGVWLMRNRLGGQN
jgi:B-box zinc finger